MSSQKLSQKIAGMALAGVLIFQGTLSFASEAVFKDETVYVNLTAQGDVAEIIVSDWLQGAAGATVEDRSALENIVNVKGEETPVVDGEQLQWTMQDEDLFYQGTVDKALPITVDVTYYFDGEEIAGKELIGKSGRVAMHLKLTNNERSEQVIDGQKRTLYTIFETASVVTLPMDVFSDVKVNTGRVVSDGNNNIITYVALPGMSEVFGEASTFVDVPETLIVEAQVEHFEMAPIVVTALSKFPDVSSIEGLDKLSDLIDAVDTLDDSAKALADAGEELSTGQATFSQKMADYSVGFGAYNEGMNRLFEALNQLKTGADGAYEGAKALSGGIVALEENTQPLVSGLGEFASGGSQFAQSAGAFSSGASELADATVGLADQTAALSTGATGVLEGVEALKAGQGQVTAGLTDSVAGVQKLKTAVKQTVGEQDPLYLSLVELETSLKALESGSQTVTQKMGAVWEGQNQVATGLNQLSAGTAKIAPVAEQLKAGSEGLRTASEGLSGAAERIGAGAEAMTSGVSALKMGAQDLENGLAQLSAGVTQAHDGKETLEAAHRQLSGATTQLAAGAEKLSENQALLSANMSKFQREGTAEMRAESRRADDGLGDFLSVKDALAERSEAYNNFTGIGEDMDGSVKFVMKTEALKIPKEEKAYVVEEKETSEGFFSWLKGLFS